VKRIHLCYDCGEFRVLLKIIEESLREGTRSEIPFGEKNGKCVSPGVDWENRCGLYWLFRIALGPNVSVA
jgi:hypothetical protein